METSHQSHERSLFVLENLMMNLMTHNTQTRNIRRPVTRTRFVRFSKPDDERELDDTQSDTDAEIGFTPQQLAHHQTSRQTVGETVAAEDGNSNERSEVMQDIAVTDVDSREDEIGEQIDDHDQAANNKQPEDAIDDTGDNEENENDDNEADENVDSGDTAGGEDDDSNDNADRDDEHESSREANDDMEAEADVVDDHDIVDAHDDSAGSEEDVNVEEAPDMETYLQESVEPYYIGKESYEAMFNEDPVEFEYFDDEPAEPGEISEKSEGEETASSEETDEIGTQMLETVHEEPDNVDVSSRGARRIPKSIRDLLEYNHPGVLEEASSQGRVDSACSPQTRAKVRRVSQRLQDLERKQTSREEALNTKRSVVRKLDPDVSEVTCAEEDNWKSWLAKP